MNNPHANNVGKGNRYWPLGKLSAGMFLLLLVIPRVSGGEEIDAVPTGELITRLTEESNQGIGSHTTAWATGFMAIDDKPRFQGGVLGSEKPAVSPVMRELVRRGLSSLPLLINHLSDARPTRLTVGDGFVGKWFADEYDARNPHPEKRGDVNTNKEIQFERYTLRVGDLCYVAVGQIVNRELNAVRYQPSLCLVVNSPVEFPALAAAVKSEWGGLSEEDHRISLQQDAIAPHSIFAPGAGLKRLVFYYPESGLTRMLNLLGRPFYDRRRAYDFFEKSLVSSDSKLWELSLSRFKAKYGGTEYLGVLHEALFTFRFPASQQMTPERRKSKEVAVKVLGRFFPGTDPYKPPFINAVSIYGQKSLLEDLEAIRSIPVDDAVLGILQRVAAMPLEDGVAARFDQCALAFTCVKRLNTSIANGVEARATLEIMIGKLRKARNTQDAEGRAAYDKNIRYLQDALIEKKPE